ncbi:mitochondrial import inner membrane translocase subunit Tim9-like [Dromiciops gliroides]|uniref:mitochondrial import inner membrane translocase subunit Tim9-like n=1 Tax=Dromiciops gliroides TaxID=33562 RepID=UPI001CC3C3DB|nr:mitochondrial import inner membrane translocase subunit Tim9-like [Dromiciops gliroides]
MFSSRRQQHCSQFRGARNISIQISETDQIKQYRKFLGTYNKLTETCFLGCVQHFIMREKHPIQQNESLAGKEGLFGQQ